jgi:hypothetical protein
MQFEISPCQGSIGVHTGGVRAVVPCFCQCLHIFGGRFFVAKTLGEEDGSSAYSVVLILFGEVIMRTIHQYSITDLRDEVRDLIARGSVGRQQRIYELRKHFGDREWQNIERLLDEYDYLLRGHIIDLVGKESWTNDY